MFPRGRAWYRLCGLSILFKPLIPKDYSEVVASTCSTLGQIAISIGVTGMLFEHSGFADYAVRRMCDVLLRDETLRSLNMDRKQELKNLLFKNIYLGNKQTDDSHALLNQLDKDTDKLLSDYYYEEYITYCDMSFMETADGQILIAQEYAPHLHHKAHSGWDVMQIRAFILC